MAPVVVVVVMVVEPSVEIILADERESGPCEICPFQVPIILSVR